MVLEFIEGQTLRQLMDEERLARASAGDSPDGPRPRAGLSVERALELNPDYAAAFASLAIAAATSAASCGRSEVGQPASS